MTISDSGRQVMRSAIEKFGKDKQRMMCIEECAELTNTLAKETRGRVTNDQIVDEIADVMIMCEQMAIIYGESEVNNRITRKLIRLKERLNLGVSAPPPMEDNKYKDMNNLIDYLLLIKKQVDKLNEGSIFTSVEGVGAINMLCDLDGKLTDSPGSISGFVSGNKAAIASIFITVLLEDEEIRKMVLDELSDEKEVEDDVVAQAMRIINN